MFERYTEKARRVIFFARYEASQFGSPYIETEHILLGVLREDKALTNRFLRSHASVESIRRQIEKHATIREKVSTSVDLPISEDGKRVLAYAAEEAERFGHKHIGTEHLLLGLLREEKCFASVILQERGIKLEQARDELARMPEEPTPRGPVDSPFPSDLFLDLTQAAMNSELEPIVGRDLELDAVMEILSSRQKKNPVLLGEPGTGKTAIIKGLAQRIADGAAPTSLADKHIFIFDPNLVAVWVKDRHGFEALSNLARTREGLAETILFLDGLQSLLTPGFRSGGTDALRILKYALLNANLQCIAAGTASDYQQLTEAIPWLGACFRGVHVRPPDEEVALKVLQAHKSRLEKFHGVTYADEALDFAVRSSESYLPGSHLPGKAIDLLDTTGSRMKLRKAAPPSEIAECQKRIRFIVHRTDSSIQNHEFEKAKFYSEEERKERENLRALEEKYHLDDSAVTVAGLKEVEETVARWTAYPFCP